MKKILVLGAAGQIGSELVPALRKIYGNENVVATDINTEVNPILKEGPFEILDALDEKKYGELVSKFEIDTIYNMVALLSAVGEQNPLLSLKVNMGALQNSLEIARKYNCAVFTPSSIGAFGDSTPHDDTPQDTIQRPKTIYGVTKVAGELLSDYYYERYGVDTRGVRYPGIISNVTLPGGGTTDYAVQIYYDAIQKGEFVCNLPAGTYLDMMYMPDAIKAAIDIMEADPSKLVHRNCFNVAAMSFDPEKIAKEIRKHLPDFKLKYDVNPILKKIADSWPNKMDDTAAQKEWNWKAEFNLEKMTNDMIEVLTKRLK